jgi:mRNA interferase RelE/StbE
VNVQYRQLFLRDLKKLKKTEIYDRIYELVFDILPDVDNLQDFPNIKAMVGYPGYYRLRLGDYRVGFALQGDSLEFMRVLHRREFYRYFP